MIKSLHSLLMGILVLLAVLFPQSTQAIVLDWNSVTWTSGALTGSFDIDPNNPGNDVTITITGSTGRFTGGRPEITTDFTGGFGSSPTPDNLELWMDFSNRSQSITVTVAFNYTGGVNAVDFMLFDVDTGPSSKGTRTFIDQVRSISAVSATSGLVAPTITTSANNSVSGSGTNQVINGTGENPNNSADGNVGISFGTNYITSFTFTYGNPSSGVQSDPDSQSIGLYDINFKPKVPEYRPGLIAAMLCLGFGLHQYWRRHRPAESGSAG